MRISTTGHRARGERAARSRAGARAASRVIGLAHRCVRGVDQPRAAPLSRSSSSTQPDRGQRLVARVAQRRSRSARGACASTRQSARVERVLEVGDPEHQAAAPAWCAARSAPPRRAGCRRAAATRRARRAACAAGACGRAPAGTKCSTRSPASTRPTRSLLRMRGEAQHRAQLGRQLALLRAGGAEAHRARDVDHQHHRELALLDEALDVGRAEARGDVPVDVAHLVAGRRRGALPRTRCRAP